MTDAEKLDLLDHLYDDVSIVVERDERGKILSRAEMKDGQRHGYSITYYANGKPRRIALYRSGDCFVWQLYDSYGRLTAEHDKTKKSHRDKLSDDNRQKIKLLLERW